MNYGPLAGLSLIDFTQNSTKISLSYTQTHTHLGWLIKQQDRDAPVSPVLHTVTGQPYQRHSSITLSFYASSPLSSLCACVKARQREKDVLSSLPFSL